MAPLIGITGEQKPASALVDVLDVLRTRNIDVFYGDYARAVVAAGGMPVWVPIDAPPAVLDRIDGLLLSGGDDIDPGAYGHEPHPALGTPSVLRDTQERTLLEAALRAELPTLGVCRGVQLINVHLGGTLHQHVPAHTDTGVPIDQAFHRVRFVDGSIGQQVYGVEVDVNSLHHQGIDRLAPGLLASGVTVGGPDDGLVEAVEVVGKPVLAVQWHPEMTGRVDPALQWLVAAAGGSEAAGVNSSS
ncbi:MAG: gamma-glutamyl-gamma-aminobutyrate hydrolase family protein [Acidimicrobiales bacterium]|jgi:putative glutamine amidotransferase